MEGAVKSPPMSPAKPSILKHSTGKILQLGSKMGTYILLSDTLPQHSLGMVSFEAKGLNDILTCFHSEEKLCVGHEGREDTAPAYEILIGGWLNTKTVIRKQGNIQAAVSKLSKPEAMITKSDFDKYWISIEGDRLAVGKGEPGENKILSWRDARPVKGIAYIGFGSWHNPVLIKNIKIMLPVITEEKLARKFDPLKVHDWFNQGRFSDVILQTPLDGQQILAHRAVLFAASRPFENIVRSSASSTDVTHLCPVHLLASDLPGPILLQIVKFIYTGKVVVDEIEAQKLALWAQHFELHGLVALCNTFTQNPRKWSGVTMKLSSIPNSNSTTKTQSETVNISSNSSIPSNGSSSSSNGPSSSSNPSSNTTQIANTTPSPLSILHPSSHDLASDTLRSHDYSRLYQRSLFSDVQFVVKSPPDAPKKYEKTVPVHKIILAMKSEPLGLMFSTGMAESTMKKIDFVEDYEIFELMLRFIYSGQPNFLLEKSLTETLIPLLTMADRFAVFPLRNALSEIFADMINLDTVCILVNVASFYRLTTLRRKTLQFVELNFVEVIQSAAFLGLEAAPLLEIIFGDDLVAPSEKAVYDALMMWGTGTIASPERSHLADSFNESFSEEEKSQRYQELKQLLSYIRYPLIDVSSLQHILEANTIIKETEYLSELVLSAIEEKMTHSTGSLGSSLPFAGSLSQSGGVRSGTSSLSSSQIGEATDAFSPSNSFGALPSFTSSSMGTLPAYYAGPIASSSAIPAAVSAVTELQAPRRASSAGLGAFHANARKSSAVQFLFSHYGDENGVIHWLATQGGSERWQNPHKLNRVVVSCSSPPSRWTSLPALVNRTFITHNFAAGGASSPAWWAVDLTAKHKLLCNYYSLQTDGSANVISDWELQASNDKLTWTTLRVHENARATFTQGGGKEFAWPVDLDLQQGNGYRYFRLIVSGPSAQTSHKFSLSGIELYGHLSKVDLPLASSTSISSDAANNLSSSSSELPSFESPPAASSSSTM
jgi:hypothetical protein